MKHHPAFSTRVRIQGVFDVPGRSIGIPAALHGKAEDALPAKDRGYLHDSAFLAERGCLGPANLPRHLTPARH